MLLRSHNRLLSTPLDPEIGHPVKPQKQVVSVLTWLGRPRMEKDAWVGVAGQLVCCPTSRSRGLGKSTRSRMDGEGRVPLVSPPQKTFLHPEKEDGDQGQQETLGAFSSHLSSVNKNKASEDKICWV